MGNKQSGEEIAQERIKECIAYNYTSLNLDNLDLDRLPNNLPSSLHHLWYSNNQIKELNNLPSSLQTLYCHNNQIKELNIVPSSLQYLFCSNNKYLHITKNMAIRFANLQETPNYNEMAQKIQRIYKYKKRQKRRKF